MDGFVPWPEDLARLYRARGVWQGVALGEALDDAARVNAERIAIVEGDRRVPAGHERRVTFGELRRLARRLASAFVARGICDGERVVFQLPNTIEFAVAYLAALKVGAIPIMCLPHHREAEIRSIANLAGASAWVFAARSRSFDYLAMAVQLKPEIPSLRELVVTGASDEDRELVTTFESLLASGREDDPELERHVPDAGSPAVLQLSGGTTGVPKLIARTHDDYLYNAMAFAAATGFTPDDVLLVPLPVGHNFALACPGLQGALLLGAKTVLAPSPAPDVVLPLVARERVTWVPAVPATVIQWTQSPERGGHDTSSLKAIYVGGQKLNPEPARAAIDAFGPVVRQVFGMAEGLLCCTRPDDPLEIHVTTQGRPTSDLDEVRIVDDDGNDVPTGAIGELLCRGPYTLRGYYRADEHNASAFTPDGFYRSGDMVRQMPCGNIVVEGRKKDLINRGGEKISAEEIEDLIMKHAAVANVALVAMADPVLGERACACIVLRPCAELDLPRLVAFLRDEHRIAPFKVPERIEIFDKLPLTGVGKVSKKDLRRIVGERIASG
jgi:2,3-dihydroxybenzoate-AMP ligase